MTRDIFQKRILTYVVLVSLVNGLFAILFLLPAFGAISASLKELDAVKHERVSIEFQRSANLDFIKNLTDIERNMKKTDALFINADAPLGFVNFLETLAARHDLLIEIHSAEEKRAEIPRGFVGLRASVAGVFPDIGRFIAQLETAPYLIEINNLQISESSAAPQKSSERGGSGISGEVISTISFKVYAK